MDVTSVESSATDITSNAGRVQSTLSGPTLTEMLNRIQSFEVAKLAS